MQKEAAEAQYWLELLIDSRVASGGEGATVHSGCSELLAIFTAIGKKLTDDRS